MTEQEESKDEVERVAKRKWQKMTEWVREYDYDHDYDYDYDFDFDYDYDSDYDYALPTRIREEASVTFSWDCPYTYAMPSVSRFTSHS